MHKKCCRFLRQIFKIILILQMQTLQSYPVPSSKIDLKYKAFKIMEIKYYLQSRAQNVCAHQFHLAASL